MAISPEAKAAIEEEERILAEVISSLEQQLRRSQEMFRSESIKARDLTSEMVATMREEDRAMLASDEAVAHALTKKKKIDVKVLIRLLKKPYFARFAVAEEEQGKVRQQEFKLSFAANPDCRIIDWRKAPISTLYYDYREGDEYSELILGRERTGHVVLRNSLDVENGKLQRITCRLGTFINNQGEWQEAGSGAGQAYRGSSGSYGRLPDVLALITPEQFQMITEDASTALLIQGIAGSGKTTVALHRLAWLLHEDNSDLREQDCLIVVLSKILKAYIKASLPALGLENVRVLTFHEWTVENIKQKFPQFIDDDGRVRRPHDPTPVGIDRVKRSLAFLKYMEEYQRCQNELGAPGDSKIPAEEIILQLLNSSRKLKELDETKLLDDETIRRAAQRTADNFKMGALDPADDAALVRLLQLRSGGVFLPDGRFGKYNHLVVDEVQDFGPIDLAVLIASVPEVRRLTLVGDSAQRLDEGSPFMGWKKLMREWQFQGELSKYVSLTVSHRSTLPIMQFADHIQKRKTVTAGRPGRVPIWFHAPGEEKGLRAALDWLKKAAIRYPNAITAVLCSSPAECKQIYSLLKPTFGAVVRLGDDNTFSFEEGIIVSSIRQVKGLDFLNVLIWNPSEKEYPAGELGQNLLYVAATRAEENLCLVTWQKPSSHLPGLYSQLIRGYDLRADEAES